MRLRVDDLGGSGETSAVLDIRIDGKPFGTRAGAGGQGHRHHACRWRMKAKTWSNCRRRRARPN